jgi:TatD DNase family protein
MPIPVEGDLINIHTHDSVHEGGVFAVENLMIHEGRMPDDSADAFSVGIHPCFLTKEEYAEQLALLAVMAADERVVAVGEAGYDRRKGPEMGLQQEAFEAQARLADELCKPLMIHCVKGWDELWVSRHRLKPRMPWIIHGFNGSLEQARQLVAGGMLLSLWVKSVLNGALDSVLTEIPTAKVFLETDGFEIPLRTLYGRAAEARGVSAGFLASAIHSNYKTVFLPDS